MGESEIIRNLTICALMLLIVSTAILSTTFAQNPTGYAAAGNNFPATTSGISNSNNMSNVSEAGNTLAQINPGAGSTYVTQLANVSAIFGLNKAENMAITYVNTAGNEWVEIANDGIAAWNMSGWRLTNRENTVYVFPPYDLESGSIVWVHEGVRTSIGIDLYTNSATPLFNINGDEIMLLDPNGKPAATYSVLGNASAATADAPASANATALGPIKNPATPPVLITPPGRANASICPSGQILCNGTCTDTSANSQNCGACGKICALDSICINGACLSPCLPGQTSCNGSCVDIGSNSQNCGACGKVCPPEAACINGVCSARLTSA
jgi:hypothetical protein